MELQFNTSFKRPFASSGILETYVKDSTIRVRQEGIWGDAKKVRMRMCW